MGTPIQLDEFITKVLDKHIKMCYSSAMALSEKQIVFLKHRAISRDDRQAATLTEINIGIVARWKQSKEFLVAYTDCLPKSVANVEAFDTQLMTETARNTIGNAIPDVIDSLLEMAADPDIAATARLGAIRTALEVVDILGDKKTVIAEVGDNLSKALQATGLREAYLRVADGLPALPPGEDGQPIDEMPVFIEGKAEVLE